MCMFMFSILEPALKRHTTGSVFLSCSLDGTVRVWSLETLTEVGWIYLLTFTLIFPPIISLCVVQPPGFWEGGVRYECHMLGK